VDGQEVTNEAPAQRPTTTVFQDYALFPHMTVAKNVAFGLAMRRVARDERRRRVEEVLGLVGLPDVGPRHVGTLSGGQRQRVALARALIVEPPVLLLDEPLGALDLKLRRQMQDELSRIQRTTGTTFVHVTHDQDEAMALADAVVVLHAGMIEDHGPPQRVYLRPATPFTAGFMGDTNVLEGTVAQRSNGQIVVDPALGGLPIREKAAPSSRVTVCIRPEHLRPDDKGPHVLGEGRVLERHFSGMYQRFRVSLDKVHLMMFAELSVSLEEGAAVTLSVDPADIVLLHPR
jgi:spermidine/putrescine transport system ATP-binding protein